MKRSEVTCGVREVSSPAATVPLYRSSSKLFLCILSDFHFDDGSGVLGPPRRADSKVDVKNYHVSGANYFPRKCDSKILKFTIYVFF